MPDNDTISHDKFKMVPVYKKEKQNIHDISNQLISGDVFIMPSDTIYGIFGCALLKKTVERIYQLKARDTYKPFIILIPELSVISSEFKINLPQNQLIFLEKIWPNPVTVIVDSNNVEFEYLHRGMNSLAFRIPNDEFLIDILNRTGPLVAPSANKEGLPPAKSIKEASSFFDQAVDAYVDGGFLEGLPSTIIKFENNQLIVVREGTFKLDPSLYE